MEKQNGEMPCIQFRHVDLARRTLEDHSYDLKRSIFSLLRGRYTRSGRKPILRDLSLQIHSGERIGIIGPNGSGKSTLLKIIAGIIAPTSGEAHIAGAVAPLIELGAGFDPELSVFDNIVQYGVLLGFSRETMRLRLHEIVAFAELENYCGSPVKTLSSGMAARLGFAIASYVDPDILLLDEVLSIGDEHFRHKCQARLEAFWQKRTTIIVVSHDLPFIEKWCERVFCLDQGRIAFTGPPRTAIRFYLDTVAAEDMAPRGAPIGAGNT